MGGSKKIKWRFRPYRRTLATNAPPPHIYLIQSSYISLVVSCVFFSMEVQELIKKIARDFYNEGGNLGGVIYRTVKVPPFNERHVASDYYHSNIIYTGFIISILYKLAFHLNMEIKNVSTDKSDIPTLVKILFFLFTTTI